MVSIKGEGFVVRLTLALLLFAVAVAITEQTGRAIATNSDRQPTPTTVTQNAEN